MTPVIVKTNEIPITDVYLLAQTFLSAVNAFYEDPQNVLKFEKWKQQRDDNTKNLLGGINHG